nr:hypothetical protein [uncultured Pseudodesulfovibrio sp.]
MAMPSAGDIKTILSSLTDLVKKGMTVEAQEKIMDLREIILELREQNIEYRELAEQFQQQSAIEEELEFKDNVLWRLKDGERIGPFCQSCWDSQKKLIRLQKDEYMYYCKVCKDEIQHTPSPPIDTCYCGDPGSYL